MYPVLFDPARARAVVAGRGQAVLGRLAGLEDAGVTEFAVFSPGPDAELEARAGARLRRRLPGASDLQGATLVLVAGLEDGDATAIAEAARAAGVPVNVEDRPQLCDFHVPAIVRRGALLITASTGGRAPGLARRLGRELRDQFGPEWGDRVEALGAARDAWRAEGFDIQTLSRRTEEWIDRAGWFG